MTYIREINVSWLKKKAADAFLPKTAATQAYTKALSHVFFFFFWQ